MCLSVPGRVVSTRSADGVAMARVDFGGVVKEVCTEYVPEAAEGDYVLVHVGFAFSVVDEESALASLAAFRELGSLEEELGAIEEPGGAG